MTDSGGERVWLNGTLVLPDAALVSALSQGLLHGTGVYDTLLARGGRLIAFDRHLVRLTEGARRLELPEPDAAALRAAAEALVADRGVNGDARLRITLCAGPAAAPGAAPSGAVTLMTLTAALSGPASAAVMTVPFRRNEHSPLAGIKYTACPENPMARRLAAAAGCDEALFLNTAGHLCEGAFSNLFLVRRGILFTPSLTSGCLAGVTRETVISLGTAEGIAVEETVCPPALLAEAEEIFLTSSVRGILPVRRIDGQSWSPDGPGPVTALLMKRYAEWLETA